MADLSPSPKSSQRLGDVPKAEAKPITPKCPEARAEAKPSTKSDLAAETVTDHFLGCVCRTCWAIRTGFDIGYASGMSSGVASGRAQAAADLEAPGSALCDCMGADSLPTNARTGARMAHHCDCRAVEAAAVMVGAYSRTAHAAQCGHGPEMDDVG